MTSHSWQDIGMERRMMAGGPSGRILSCARCGARTWVEHGKSLEEAATEDGVDHDCDTSLVQGVQED